MLGQFSPTGQPTAMFYVRMAIILTLGISLVVVSIAQLVAGRASGVALVFGVMFTGFGVFRMVLAVRLRRAAAKRNQGEPPEAATR